MQDSTSSRITYHIGKVNTVDVVQMPAHIDNYRFTCQHQERLSIYGMIAIVFIYNLSLKRSIIITSYTNLYCDPDVHRDCTNPAVQSPYFWAWLSCSCKFANQCCFKLLYTLLLQPTRSHCSVHLHFKNVSCLLISLLYIHSPGRQNACHRPGKTTHPTCPFHVVVAVTGR